MFTAFLCECVFSRELVNFWSAGCRTVVQLWTICPKQIATFWERGKGWWWCWWVEKGSSSMFFPLCFPPSHWLLICRVCTIFFSPSFIWNWATQQQTVQAAFKNERKFFFLMRIMPFHVNLCIIVLLNDKLPLLLHACKRSSGLQNTLLIRSWLNM